MTSDTALDAHPDAFVALLTQGLITNAQHHAALAHPETPSLAPLPGPAHALAWMRVRGLITEAEQNAALDKVEAAVPEHPHADDASLSAMHADDMLELVERGITHEALQTLHAQGLIDTDTRDLAMEETPVVGSVPAAVPATLAWLVTDELLEKERFEATRAQVAAEPPFAMAAERARTVRDAQALIDADAKAMKAWQSRTVRTRRVGALKLMLGVLVIGGGLGWYLFSPTGVPACDAASTRKTLDSLMFRVAMDVRMRTLNPTQRAELRTPSVSSMREIGFRKPDRVRGCAAVMTQGDSKDEMAYTIGPVSPDSNDMVVRGADIAIVQARFGNLDASGKPRYNAEPIGRAALEKAFREGAAPLGASLAAFPQRARKDLHLIEKDPERSREIADIEVTGPCRALENQAAQACPLVVEYNDRLLSAIGGDSSTLTLAGDFQFVQDGGAWRVSDDFAKTFARKVAQARLKSMGLADSALPQ
ncbi:hypothetical protein VLK31_11905 [Variovorax sp. H27-G14]|uniref:hypothetical protein n=1 Tax=Variovorax sp. H27-G14 TaxID=3111914 RepID=UPI0038FD1B04